MQTRNASPVQTINERQLSFEFSPESFPLHVEMINNEPWFLAKDVCDILGFQNPTDILSKMLDEDEKLTYTIDRAGQARNMNFVNESGLYNLIFRSSKPQAKRFRKVVTSEILPSIRKTGSYSVNSKSKKVDFNHIESVLPYVDQREHEGQTVYAAAHLFKMLGRASGSHVMVRARKLAEENKAFKLISKEDSQEKWFVVREGIGRLLNVKPRNAGDIAIIKQLKEGGML